MIIETFSKHFNKKIKNTVSSCWILLAKNMGLVRHYDGETIFFVYTSMAVYISHNNGAGPHSGLMLTLGFTIGKKLNER